MFDATQVASSEPEHIGSLLDDLAEELVDLDISHPAAPEVPSLLVRIERFRAVLDGVSLGLLGRIDAEGLHEADGLVSSRSWLKQHSGTAGDTAARRLKLARQLRDAPLLADALRSGRITMDAARIVLAARRPSTQGAFEMAESTLVDWAESLHIDDLATAVRRWLELADQDGSDPERHWKDRNLWLSQTLGGSWQLRGRLAPEQGARLRAQLDDEMSRSLRADAEMRGDDGGSPTPAQRAADALIALVDPPGASSHGRRSRARLTVLTNLDDLRLGLGARLSTGEWIDGAAVARIACDAELLQVYQDSTGRLLGVYSEQRVPDARLRAAVLAMFPTCVVPGCDVTSSRCDLHHVVPWALGGRTDTDNIRPLCPRHHTLCHRQGWVLRDRARSADGRTMARGCARRTDERGVRSGRPVDGVPTPVDGRVEIHRPGRPPIDGSSRWDRARSP